jgi:hypothetical protein
VDTNISEKHAVSIFKHEEHSVLNRLLFRRASNFEVLSDKFYCIAVVSFQVHKTSVMLVIMMKYGKIEGGWGEIAEQ